MYIQVQQELAEDFGHSKSYRITGEQLELAELEVTGPVDGNVQLVRTETGILVAGQLDLALMLDCHRCLRRYEHPFTIRFEASYAIGDPDYPIVDDQIDLAPLICEETILAIPAKQLCSTDCPGLPEAAALAPEPIVRKPTVVMKESTPHHGSAKETHHPKHQGPAS